MTVLSLITLSVMNRLELKMFPLRQNKFLEIYFRDTMPQMSDIMDILAEHSVSILSSNVRTSRSKKRLSKLVLFINVPKGLNIKTMTCDFQKLQEIDTVSLKEKESEDSPRV